MNAYQRNGLIVGAALGALAAVTHWEGNILQSLGAIAGGAVMGYLAGHFIHRNGG